MSVAERTDSFAPLRAPKVNSPSKEARVVPSSMDAIVRMFNTAGNSENVPPWDDTSWRYAEAKQLTDLLRTDLPEGWEATGTLSPDWPIVISHQDPLHLGRQINLVIGRAGPIASMSMVPEAITAGLRDPFLGYAIARSQVQHVRSQALAEIQSELDRHRAVFTTRSPQDVVVELLEELGLSQLTVARCLGVTPTAVRKWKRGEPARPEYRNLLSYLAATCRYLEDVGVHDPGGWLEVPISATSEASPADLFMAGRADLLVLFAAGLSDPGEVVGEMGPSWVEKFASDPEYEVVQLGDGSRSVVPRSGVPG